MDTGPINHAPPAAAILASASLRALESARFDPTITDVQKHRRHILDIVNSDATFERTRVHDGEAWVGRCLFCKRKLAVSLEGLALSALTVEHIVPRSHGGTDTLENLALACPDCNHEKGMRHDKRRKGDPRLAEIIAALQARRRERWR